VFPVHSNKKQTSFEEESIGIISFCGILDPAALQDCTKFPSLSSKASSTVFAV